MGRAFNLSYRWFGNALQRGVAIPPRSIPSHAASARAVALLASVWEEPGPTMQTSARHRRDAVRAGAVCIESRGAIWADDPQILKPVVVRDAVDVIEDQRHPATAPNLVLSAQLAIPRFEAFCEQSSLDMAAVIRGVFDEHFLEGDRGPSPVEEFPSHCIWVEMVGIDAPQRRVFLERLPVPTRAPIAKPPQGFSPRP